MKLKYKIASIIMLVGVVILIPLSIMYNWQNYESIKKQELKSIESTAKELSLNIESS